MVTQCRQLVICIMVTCFLCGSVVITAPSVELPSITITESSPYSDIPDRFNVADLVEVEYIGINGNDELLQMAEDNNWPGAGYEWDPIIISGYYFRSAVHHFVVDNTDLYWEFRDNVLDGIDERYCEIVIGNLRNGRISNNYFVRGAVGIHGIRVEDCVFANNEFYNQSWDGVLLEYSHNNIIIGNTFIDEGEAAFLGWVDSDNNNILYNEVYGSLHGLMFWAGSDGNTVQHNSIHDVTEKGIDRIDKRPCRTLLLKIFNYPLQGTPEFFMLLFLVFQSGIVMLCHVLFFRREVKISIIDHEFERFSYFHLTLFHFHGPGQIAEPLYQHLMLLIDYIYAD